MIVRKHTHVYNNTKEGQCDPTASHHGGTDSTMAGYRGGENFIIV